MYNFGQHEKLPKMGLMSTYINKCLSIKVNSKLQWSIRDKY